MKKRIMGIGKRQVSVFSKDGFLHSNQYIVYVLINY